MIDNQKALERALAFLGQLLAERALSYEIVVGGAGGLVLLGLLQRPTRDLDVLALVSGGRYVKAKPLPQPLSEAVRDSAQALGLANDWLNAGPADLLDFGLPAGFEERVTTRRFGGLTVHAAGRFDQICMKVYASVDQGPRSRHFADLKRLEPSATELLEAGRWARSHDPSDGFRSSLLQMLEALGVSDADSKL